MKLVLEKINKNYDKKVVLENVNYEFEEGKIYGLLGRNGSGKTTLFNCINNDIDYTGNIYLSNDNQKYTINNEMIGYSISEPLVPEFLTGREFLQFFIDINKNHIKNVKTIEEYFDMMNINRNDIDKLLKEYSFGMKNKMQMLVNIIMDSKILLLDEPLTSLDVIAQDEMKQLLKEIKKDRILILSTHIMELALDLCDEITIINNKTLHKIDEQNKNKEYIIEYIKGTDNE